MGHNIYAKVRTEAEALKLMRALIARDKNNDMRQLKKELKELCRRQHVRLLSKL